MLWIRCVGAQNTWWKPTQFNLPCYFFFSPLTLLYWFSTLDGSALALVHDRGIHLICPGGKKSFCFMFSFIYIAQRNSDRLQLAAYGWAKENANYFSSSFVAMKIYSSWLNQACIGHRWDELGLSLCAVPKELPSQKLHMEHCIELELRVQPDYEQIASQF